MAPLTREKGEQPSSAWAAPVTPQEGVRGDTETRGARGPSHPRDPSHLNHEELLRLHPTDTPPCETVGRRAERRSKNNGPTESKGQTQSRQRGWLWVNRALPPTRRPGGPHGAAPSRAPKGLRVHPPLPRDVASTRSPSSACRTSPPPHHLPLPSATHSGVSH